MQRVFLYGFGVIMIFAGLNHFLARDTYIAMVPEALPWKGLLVDVSGIAEMLGGLGLFHPRTRKLAAWGLIALFLAVFPANINMAINHLPLGHRELPTWALWARLPVQLVFIGWAYWCSKRD